MRADLCCSAVGLTVALIEHGMGKTRFRSLIGWIEFAVEFVIIFAAAMIVAALFSLRRRICNK